MASEDPLEKEMATHSSTLGWKIPWTEEPGRLQSMGSQRVGHDWATSLTHVVTQESGRDAITQTGIAASMSYHPGSRGSLWGVPGFGVPRTWCPQELGVPGLGIPRASWPRAWCPRPLVCSPQLLPLNMGFQVLLTVKFKALYVSVHSLLLNNLILLLTGVSNSVHGDIISRTLPLRMLKSH